MKEVILKYALENASKFNGKANPGAVIGKVLNENPKLKSDMKSLALEVNKTIKEIASMPVEEQIKKLETIAPELLEDKPKEEKTLKPLKDAKAGKVVMRFAPSPSGPMHLGHAYGITLSSEYCRLYKGKLILRIEDTNPDNIYEPSYKLLPEDAKWVTKDNIVEVMIQSDRLGIYYDYANNLVDQGNAYVCTCEPDKFKELIFDKKPCPCRALEITEQQARFNNMFSSYKPGEAVLRVKTDIQHKNPAMRDFPIMRINTSPHPRQKTKHRVWPLMNLSVFVDDVESGMTHIIRAKEHMDNAKRQEFLYKFFNKPIPETLFLGRLNFEGLPISCSETKEAIAQNKYSDWDDIRLPFLLALKKRGYQPEAFIKWALDIGVTQTDKTVKEEEAYTTLDNFNREIIDKKTNRYFFIEGDKHIEINNLPKELTKIKIPLHPEYPKRGSRELKLTKKLYIQDQIQKTKNYRFMYLCNTKGQDYTSTEYDSKLKAKPIHWLPMDPKQITKIKVLRPDNKLKEGISEHSIKNVKEGTIVQFERFGFARLINKKEKLFWFLHN